jgi:PKD repeat protein/N-acetylneuraminic acid mutarotase
MISHILKITDGNIDVSFLHGSAENPLINGIEILDASEDDTPIYVHPIADQFNNTGDVLGGSLGVNAYGGDGNKQYTATNLPPGVVIEPTNGQIGGAIDANADLGSPYNVTIEVNDSDGTSTDITSINFAWYIGSNVWIDKNENENYTARHECSLVQAGDKFFLMGGRENATTVDIYDYTTNTWTNLTNSAPAEFNHFQATEYQGLIWVIGAFNDNGFPNEVPEEFIWVFNPATSEWIQGPQIPASRRRGSTGLVVYNDKFYVLGGNTDGHDGGYVAWFDEYDPATGVWTSLVDAPRARDHFHATVIGSKLYAAGGRLSGGAGGVFKPVIPEVDVFDFVTGTWSTLPAAQNIPTPRGGPSAVNFNSKLLVFGGEVENELVDGANTSGALDITEEYDPATQSWSRIADLNHARHGTQGIVSGTGVFVLGGSPSLGGGSQKNMEFLGNDNPVGTPSNASSLVGPTEVIIADGTTENIQLNIVSGNVGVMVSSMEISGFNADDYTIVSGGLTNQLLGANSSHTLAINLSGTGTNRTAILTINYDNGDSTLINLTNFDSNINVTNPGTQNNNEGDVVSLQIQANGANTYSASGLPPTLTIDPATGLISGTVSSGGTDGPFEEQGGLVVIEAESGTTVPTWSQTTDGGAIGIIAGSDHFSTQSGGTIPYEMTITTPGVYRFTWRSFFSGSSTTDENDNWLRFPNDSDVWFFGFKGTPTDEASLIANVQSTDPVNIVFPKGSSRITPQTTPEGNGSNGFFKIFRSGGTSQVYDWQALTSDNDSHDVYVWFVNPGTYTMEISERSAGHAIDKIALYKLDGTNYSDAQLTAAPESQQSITNGAAENSPYNVTVTVTDGGNPPNTANTQFLWYIGEIGDPIAVAEATPVSGFAPLEVSFTGSNSTDDIGIVSYLWDFKDGSATVTDADPLHTFNTAGTYEVELTVEDADGNTSLTTVTINVSNPSSSGDIRINSGGPNITFGPETWIADIYFNGGSTFDTTEPIANTDNDALYQTERFTTANTLVYEIPVPAPGDYNVDLHFAELYFGAPGFGSDGGVGSRVFNITVENGQVQVDNYDIFEEAGGALTAIVEQYQEVNVTDGFLTITLTKVVENPKISGIAVFASRPPLVDAGEDQTIVLPMNSASMTGTGTDPDGGPITAYQWTQENGPNTATLSGATTADLTADNLVEGVYVFRLTLTDDEGDTGFDDVTITVEAEGTNLPPTAVAEANPLSGQLPLLVNFTGSNSTDDMAIVSYFWDFKDGATSTDTNPSHTFSMAGTYEVELTVTDGGGLTDTTTVTIVVTDGANQPPTALAEAIPLTGAPPLLVTFTGSNSSDDVGVVEYFWDFMDGSTSTEADPTHSFPIQGTYEVSLTVTDAEGLTDTDTITILVTTETTNEPPVAIVSANPLNGDAPLIVQFTGNASTDDVAIATYFWDFNDGNTSAMVDPEHIFNTPGTYEVELTVTDGDGLSDTESITITVTGSGNQAPNAIATGSPLTGSAPLEVAFTGSASTDDGGVVSYAWDFMDGSSSSDADPIHTFTQEGTYNVELTVTDVEGLTDTATVTIIVGEIENQAPIAVAQASPTSGESPLLVSFTGSNSSDDSDIISYAWDFMDGNSSTEADPMHTFNADGTYNVELTVTDAEGLTDTAMVSVVVGANANQPPQAVISMTTTAGVAPFSVNFVGSDSMDDFGIVSYLWAFGDGTTSTEVDVQKVYDLPGTYIASLTVEDAEGLVNTVIVVITVTQGSRMNIIFESNPPVASSGIAKLVMVNRSEDIDVVNITLHDIGGRYINGYLAEQVLNGGNYDIPVGNLNVGIYLVRVNLSNGEDILMKLMIRN